MFEYYCTACQETVESKTRIGKCPLCSVDDALLFIRGGVRKKTLRMIHIRCSNPQLWKDFVKRKGEVTTWKALEKLIRGKG